MVSYSLCKESDVIISTCNTLAEESLAYGKKVIFINDLFPLSNVALNTYTKDFYFCIASSFEEVINMAKKYLIMIKNLMLNLINYKKKYLGI